MPDLRPQRGVERELAVAAVLQRTLQADRSGSVGVGAALNSRQYGRGGREAEDRWRRVGL